MKVMLSPPSLDGELSVDDATRNGGADDFGHIVHKMPLNDARVLSADNRFDSG